MHEATIDGSERIGHNTSGGIEIAISSRIEIMVSGYRQSLAFVDALEPGFHHKQDGLFRSCLADPLRPTTKGTVAPPSSSEMAAATCCSGRQVASATLRLTGLIDPEL